jgi:hypothetical protein
LIEVAQGRRDRIAELCLLARRAGSVVQSRDQVLDGREEALVAARRHIEGVAGGRLAAQADL